ncbi:ArsR family transcriptional regulator [Thalassotalea euphylliae]|uniref:ArsR family transcriptional regulator n=2 Tax=Thalassotalea euphylliae TaxID=1655234 RepID=A0A3E0TXT3_9GAMM|nr:ArsR family transcriptional regulator [Thalassotalea euphylliae]
MAEVILRAKAGDTFDVFSAGTQPEGIDERTLATLAKFGLGTQGLRSKSLSEIAALEFDYVITLCDQAMQECRSFETKGEQIAWDFPDPKARLGVEPFTTTFTEINNRIEMFLVLNDQSSTTREPKNAAPVALEPISFYKCLTDDIRLKTLLLTNYFGEICVCELMEALDEESQPKVSRNLAVLKKAGVLTARKNGQWVFYRINPDIPLWAKQVISQTLEHNVDLIRPDLTRLTTMENRPDKASFCG